MTTETPAEVLAETMKLLGLGLSTQVGSRVTFHATRVKDMRDRLSRSLATGKVAPVAWMLRDSRSKEIWLDEICVWTSMAEAQDCADDMNANIETASFEVFALYTAPPADPAKASEPDHNRDPIARKLDGAADTLRMLREADSTTAKASRSAPDGMLALVEALDAAMVESLLGEGADIWKGNRGKLRNRLPENVGAILGRMRALLATPPASAPEVTEFPKKVTKTVCDGCPNLRTKRWKDHLDNDETDSGTEATCAQADRHISMYWHDGNATPAWCPLTAALQQQEGKSHD